MNKYPAKLTSTHEILKQGKQKNHIKSNHSVHLCDQCDQNEKLYIFKISRALRIDFN